MSAARVRAMLLVVFSTLFVGRSPTAPSSDQAASSRAAMYAASRALARMPIRFEANVGQHDEAIRFVARRGAAAIALRDDGAIFVLRPRTGPKESGARADRIVIGLKPEGARIVTPRAEGELVTRSSYFIGDDPSKWRSNVPSYAKVTYPSVLDGVDLVYHGERGALEYDFIVAPGADVDSVTMNVDGASEVSISERGELRIHTDAGDVVQPPPIVYQRDARGAKHEIASRYRLVGAHKIGFEVAAYDVTKPLVIDPVLGYATYLGGAGDDEITSIAADAAGNTFVTGLTSSVDFPTTAGAYDPTFNVVAPCLGCPVDADAFVAKLDPSGSQLLYATYLGGTGYNAATAIAVGADGTTYVAGETTSSDFPNVSPLPTSSLSGAYEGFVARVAAGGGALLLSTYLGGSGDDHPRAIAVDGSGIYVAGTTTSEDIGGPPQGPGADRDGFIVKVAPTGASYMYVRYLGGAEDDVLTGLAVDASGSTYVTGHTRSTDFPQTASPLKPSCQGPASRDAFVAKLDAAGAAFAYVTCLGGAGDDEATKIAVDASGSAYVTGTTWSADFPTLATIQPFGGASDVFVSKLDPTGTALVYSTFIGGSDDDAAVGIALGASGTAWITGSTRSTNYPVVAPLAPIHSGGGASGRDAVVTHIDASGTKILWSSFYGGASSSEEGAAIAVSGPSVHLGGNTSSTDLPLFGARQPTNAGGQDGFVAKLTVQPLVISPAILHVSVGVSAQFAATGGAGSGYVFSLQANGSGAAITPSGTYSSGLVGDTVDVVRVTDGAGLTATATVHVGSNTTALAISPVNASVPPKGTRGFTASGGAPPYSFSLGSNASGGTMTPSGTYTAGAKGGVTDVVRVTDSAGSNVQATVAVGAAIAIAPSKPAAPPNGSVSFSATGGSGAGYSWSLTANGSGGSIVAATGQYSAGPGSSTVDTVQVTDSLGNRGSVNVSVGGGLTVAPSHPTTTTRGAIAFSAVGGSGIYTWSLATAASGATIDASSGAYVAGTVGDTIDVVRVQDSVGNAATAKVTVGPSLTIDPPAATAAPTAGPRPDGGAPAGEGVRELSELNIGGGGAGADCGCRVVGRADGAGAGRGVATFALALALGLARRRRP